MTLSLLFLNSRGQALVETLLSLPALVSGATLVLGGLHSLFAFYWVDHWTYQLSQCLAKETIAIECTRDFEKRVQLLPFAKVEVIQQSQWGDQVQVKTQLHTALIPNKVFQLQRNTEFTSGDFGDAL